jgi:hypothetical protein
VSCGCGLGLVVGAYIQAVRSSVTIRVCLRFTATAGTSICRLLRIIGTDIKAVQDTITIRVYVLLSTAAKWTLYHLLYAPSLQLGLRCSTGASLEAGFRGNELVVGATIASVRDTISILVDLVVACSAFVAAIRDSVFVRVDAIIVSGALVNAISNTIFVRVCIRNPASTLARRHLIRIHGA